MAAVASLSGSQSGCMLLALEIGGTLLQKSRSAFLLVVRRTADAKQSGFQEEAFGQCHVQALIHRFHAVLNRQRGHADDLLRNLFRARDQPLCWYDFIYQPDAVGFLRGNHYSREKNLHGQSSADQPRQALRATIARDDAKLYFGLAELCVLAGQAYGARHGDLAAAAQSEAVNASDHGLAQVLNQIQCGLAFVCVRLGLDSVVLRQFIDIRAGNESLLAATCKNDDTNLFVVL